LRNKIPQQIEEKLLNR